MFKWVIRVLVVAVVCLFIAVALLPTVASTSWGQKHLIQLVNQVIPGKVSAEKVSLSWFSKQRIENLALRDPEDQPVLSLSLLSIDAPLWKLLCCTRDIGQTRVEGLNVTLREFAPGDTNLQRALTPTSQSPSKEKASEKEEHQRTFPFIGNVEVIDSSLTLQQPDSAAIQLSHIDALVTIASKKGPITAKLTGTTKKGGQEGQFKVDFDTSTADQIHLHVNVNNLPVDIIAQVVSMRRPVLGSFLGDLLGDNLSLTVDQTITDRGTQFQLKGHSSNLNVDFSGSLHDNQIILDRTGVMSVTLTPRLMNGWLHRKRRLLDYDFDKAIEASLVLDKLSIPLDMSADHPYLNGAIQAQIELTPFALVSTKGAHRFTFTGIKGSLESPEEAEELTFKASGALIEKNQRAPISISGKLDAAKGIDMMVEVGQLPLVLVDQVFKKNKGYVVEALGEHANFSVHASTRDEGLFVALQMKTERLTLPFTEFHITDYLTLIRPTTIAYQIDPALLAQWVPQTKSLGIVGSVPLKLNLQQFSMPLEKEKIEADDLFIEASAVIPLVQMKGLKEVGETRLQDVQMSLSGTTLANAKCSFRAKCEFIKPTTFATLWGLHTVISGDATVGVDTSSEARFQMSNLSVMAESEYSKIVLKGKMDGSRFFVTSPITWHYTLLPKTAMQIPLMQQHQLVLLNPMTIQTTLEPFEIDFNQSAWEDLHLNGKTKMNQLAINGERYNLQTSVHRAELLWEVNGPANVLHFATVGQTTISTNTKEGTFDADILVGPWHHEGDIDFSHATTNTKANMTTFPVSVVSAISGISELETLIGRSVNLHLSARADQGNSATSEMNITVIGDQFQWSGIFTVGQDIELQNKEIPSILHWTMTPERFATLRRMSKKDPQAAPETLILANKAELRLKISQLKLPDWRYLHGSFTAEVSSDRLNFLQGARRAPVIYGPAMVRLQSHDFMQSLALTTYLQEISAAKAPLSLLEGSATIDHLLTEEGAINHQKMIIKGEAKGKSLPLSFLCHIACLSTEVQDQLHALIGERPDVDTAFQLQNKAGPISVKVMGVSGQLIADAYLKESVITLLKPLEAQFTVTPKLSQTVFEKIVPFLKSAVRGEKPVRITVRPQGFAMPLRDLNMKTLQAPKMTIDLGKITFSNKGQVADVMELLNRDKGPVAQEHTIWFTPLYIGTENGVVSIERLDMLLDDRFPIAMWGQVNFYRERIDLKIGLTAETLRQSLGIGGLAQDYMLVLPLKGPLDDPEIDKTKAAARISALIAQSQGGPGQIIGGVIDLLSGGLKEERIPQPTTNPLPWETTPQEPPQQQKASNQPDLLNTIQSEAKSLLNNIFKQ
jgi:hypothetical protein